LVHKEQKVMSAREQILKSITTNKPSLVELPVMDINRVIVYDDIVAQYRKVLESIGGAVIELNNIQELQQEIEKGKSSGNYIINTIAALGTVDEGLAALTSHQLEAVDKAYIHGTVAVSENAAIWIYEHQMINRLLPFICQHLVLVIERKNIVATMHQAYQKIDIAKEGFGVFIAGPSKTADIEQSLVIGAHGARSLVVYLI
jgi:L-lactate dehydrogenase complex protein LldG